MRRPVPEQQSGALAASIACLLYLNTLPSGLVFDDHRAIESNACVQSSGGWAELGTPAFWRSLIVTDFWGTPLRLARSHRSYRPLAVLSLRFDVQLSATFAGGTPSEAAALAATVHAVNAMLHGFNVWLVWLHVRATLRGQSAALAAALLFGAHPINTEAVAYGVGRADLLAATLGLAALRCHERASCAAASRRLAIDAGRTPHTSRATVLRLRACAAALLALALAAKETAVVLLLVCVASDMLLLSTRSSKHRSTHTPRLAHALHLASGWGYLLVLAAGFVCLRTMHVGGFGAHFRRLDNPLAYAPSATARILSTARVHALSLSLLVWPATLSADYSFDAVPMVTSLADPMNLCAAGLYASLAAAFGTLLYHAAASPRPIAADVARAGLFWLLLLGLTYAPASHILAPLSFVVAERLLYLPSAATACLAAAALSIRRGHVVKGVWVTRWARRVLLGVFLIAAGARTMVRNLDWRDDTALFTAASLAYPRSAKAHYQLADRLVQRGAREEAAALLHRVLDIEPQYHYAHLHLSKMALENGEHRLAAAHARASLRAVASPNAHGHALAARALLELHHRGERLVEGGATADRNADTDTAGDLTLADASASHARAAIATDPEATDVASHLLVLGEALSVEAKWEEAAAAFGAAAVRRPHDPAIMVNHAAALLQMGQRREAATRFRRAHEVIERVREEPSDRPAELEARRRLADKARRGLELASDRGERM